jgi:hypothetical protein
MARQLKDLLSAYAEYTSKSDSPQVFHLWMALGTIMGVAQRKINMHAMYFDVHTNLYVILVSPPGRARKGAALRTAKNFLKRVEPKVNFATESSSPEGLIKLFTKITNPVHQSLSIFSMELGTLMSTRPGEMVDFLTDIFDCNPDWDRQTIAHERQTITRPWLSVYAGTTPKWLGDKLGLIALEGGLVARSIFPYSEDRNLENSWPAPNPILEAVGDRIVNDLSHIAALEGEFKFDGGIPNGEAYIWYDRWYKDPTRFPRIEDPRTITYFDRKHIHLLKVAMALSLSYKDDLILTVEDLTRAKALLDATEPGMAKALGAAGKNPLAVETVRIASMLQTEGAIPYRTLVIKTFHDLGKKNLDIVLDDIVAMGRARRDGPMIVWTGKGTPKSQENEE